MSAHIHMGLYGDTNVGKSRLLATAGRDDPSKKILIIKAPYEKIDSWLPEDKARAASGQIEVAEIRDHDDLSGPNGLLPHLREEGEQWDWVMMDGVQTIFEVGMDDMWEVVIAEKPGRARYGLDQAEYGITMDRISRWLRYTLGPDKFNFAFTTWAERSPSPDKDEDGDPIEKLMPYIQGKGMPLKFCGYMNLTGYMTTAKVGDREGVRVIRTESSTSYYAGDKFDAFNGRIVDPTIPKIEAAVKKSSGWTTPPVGKSNTTTRAATGRRVVRRK
jgi:hypothetical protein